MKRFFIPVFAAGCLLSSVVVSAVTALPSSSVDKAFYERLDSMVVKDELSGLLASDSLDERQKEALKFLYAYMSLPDIASYPASYYMENINSSLKARDEMDWGHRVPDREWLHFVLPVRINNENLDMSRPAFYAELKERVKGLSMEDAILEVNHWCHEKVTYKPSDARTSSPLSSISQAIGRCGEESTFTVAALRSVGIPARQVYTPRWAHTDDNHAWVEAWADGRWHFIGACEPEPVLDLAWFNAPASRGMIMNTNVFGDYDGPEEVLWKHPLVTRINVTSNYAPVHQIDVEVSDTQGNRVKDATVNFCLYNYAEYYPVASKKSGEDGRASLLAGKGDMVVWASDGNNYGFAKAKASDNSVVKIVLDKNVAHSSTSTFDLTPPPGGVTIPEPDAAQKAANIKRLAYEDSIRHAYMATFATEEQARELARELGVDADVLARTLVESRGNHGSIIECLKGLEAPARGKALDLLMSVSEKDRRDIPMEVVVDNIKFTPERPATMEADIYNRYVLNPRVENEGLVPYKQYLSGLFPEAEAVSMRENPQILADWIDANIVMDVNENPQNLRMNPMAVYKAGKGNPVSRNMIFVAVARSIGIPARIDPVTAKTQYASSDGSGWHDVSFGATGRGGEGVSAGLEKGMLQLDFSPEGYVVDPKYYSSFSISKIEDGLPRLLEYDEGESYSTLFRQPVALDAGSYILVTGQRLANGGVLAENTIFTIKPGATTVLPLHIRQDSSAVSVIGALNAENIYHDLSEDADKSILSTTGRGYYILGIIAPNHEPSAHALNDIAAVKTQLEDAGNRIVVLFGSEGDASSFRRELFKNLPSTLCFGVDKDNVSLNEIRESLHLGNPDYPVFVIADSFNRIVFVSSGYTIGLGEQLLQTLSKIGD